MRTNLNWIAFASIVFFFAAILFLLGRREDLNAVLAAWNGTDPVAFCLAVVLALVVQAISALRVKIIAAAEGLHTVGYLAVLRIQFISQFIVYGAPIAALSDV